MIPIFFTRYKKAPLATCVSFLSTAFYAIAAYMVLAYILNWDGLRDGASAVEIILLAVVFVAVGFGLMKLAEWLALRKQKKLAEKEAASGSASTVASRTAETTVTSRKTEKSPETYWTCAVCGTRVSQTAAYCTHCGASRDGRIPGTSKVTATTTHSTPPASTGMDSSLWETPTDF